MVEAKADMTAEELNNLAELLVKFRRVYREDLTKTESLASVQVLNSVDIERDMLLCK